MNGLSVVITTFNEEKNIKDCLESIKWVDEIIIVDGGSEDRTREIARNYTDKIFQKENTSNLNINKNFGFESAKNKWILSLDADERIPENLKEEIIGTINKSNVDGYLIPRKNYFLGKWIRHCGWHPDYQLRLFKKGKGVFECVHVHELIKIEGNIDYIKNPFLHFSYPDLTTYIKKLNFYTTFEAEFIYKEKMGKIKNIFLNFITKPQNRRPILRHIWWKYIPCKPLFRFFLIYFLQKGFLDGKRGLILAFCSAFSDYVSMAKYWYLRINRK